MIYIRMTYILIFILCMIIIILYYYKNKITNKSIVVENYFQEEEEIQEQDPFTYSKNRCGTTGKQCSVINNKTNTCCDGLYCVRKEGNFHNKICSKNPDTGREKGFKDNMTKFGDYIKGLKDTVFIEDCPYDEEGNEISNNYQIRNICNNGFYKIPIPCMRKKKSNTDFEFPETTLFSTIGDKNCIK